jgi:hypothetical protein
MVSLMAAPGSSSRWPWDFAGAKPWGLSGMTSRSCGSTAARHRGSAASGRRRIARDRRGTGRLTVRRAVQQLVWQHGCGENRPCGRRYGAHCPTRHSGGVVVGPVKSACHTR